MSWHGAKDHSTLIKIDWPVDNLSAVNSLTASTLNSSPLTPITPVYDLLETDSDDVKGCDSCKHDKKCLKCELKECSDYETIENDFKDKPSVKEFGITLDDEHKSPHDSLEPSPINSTDISYQNLNRLSAISTNSSTSDPNSTKKSDKDRLASIMTSSHESSSSYSNASPSKNCDELYECYSFTRPNYINLSNSTSKSSSTSPLKSPLRSTISITFRSPTKSPKSNYETLETPTNERDSVYEDIDLEKSLSIVEEATVPKADASLPTQEACQPEDLIILETPTEDQKDNQVDVYSQVKFFKKSVDEVNAMVLESPENKDENEEHSYENLAFPPTRDNRGVNYENVKVVKICDKNKILDKEKTIHDNEPKTIVDSEIRTKSEMENDNGNIIKPVTTNLNVRQLANKFESPTEQKGSFNFKVSTLERNKDKKEEAIKKDVTLKLPPPVSPKTYKLNKCSNNARSLDENAFVKEFGCENAQYIEKRKSTETKDGKTKYKPDLNLNLNLEEVKIDEQITPVSENKISLIQRFDDKRIVDTENQLSRERIEKYKEERRNFLREKYSSQSFRSNNPSEHFSRLKMKKQEDEPGIEEDERGTEELAKFERRNTVDLGQRMRFSLAKSVNNLDTINSPEEQKGFSMTVSAESSRNFDNTPRASANHDR